MITVVSNVASNTILFSVIIAFIIMAVIRRINVYDAFIDGAKEGFSIAIKIIPYLVAILVAIGVFRGLRGNGHIDGGYRTDGRGNGF